MGITMKQLNNQINTMKKQIEELGGAVGKIGADIERWAI